MPDRAPLWTSAQAAAATGGRINGDWAAFGLSIDTRTLRKGDLFIALEGEHRDGHGFAAAALEIGAAAALVNHRPADVADDAPLLIAEETLPALERLGKAARERTDARIIAVTGSVGKTSTKEALGVVFSAAGPAHSSAASYNNHWGVPLTLARMPAGTKTGIFEIGMNHAGEISPLSRMVRPQVAIITTVEPVHLAYFRDVHEIAAAKAEIFDGLEPGGTAILNADNAHFKALRKKAQGAGANVISFGTAKTADVRLIKAAYKETCTCIAADLCGQPVTYKLGAPGRHWAMNSLAVLASVHALGDDLAHAALAMARVRPPSGRGERHIVPVGRHSITLIDESYNANPASMRAALALLGQSEPGHLGRRIAVLGDMLELGNDEAGLHAGLAADVAAHADLAFLAGPLMKSLWDGLDKRQRGGYAASSTNLEAGLLSALRPGDAVMVKGSLGSRMQPLVEAVLALGHGARAETGSA